MRLALEEVKIKAKKVLKQSMLMAGDSVNDKISLMACQRQISRQLGFEDFNHARLVLTGQAKPEEKLNFGSIWYAPACTRFTNQWFSSYAEAQQVQKVNRLYLLPYQQQFLLVEPDFLFTLGLNGQDVALLERAKKDLVALYPSEIWDKLAQIRIRSAIDVNKQVQRLNTALIQGN